MANPTNTYSTVRESIVGDGVGSTTIVESLTARTEILVGERVGLELKAELLPGQVRELVVGDGVGSTNVAELMTIVREVLITEAPFKVSAAIRETLVSMPNEDLSVHRLVKGYVQAAVQLRPRMALPGTVKSPRFVPSLRQQAVVQAVRQWNRSGDFVMTLRQQAVCARSFVAAPQVRSTIRMNSMRMQVVQSRGQTYVPSSGLYAKGYRQQVIQHRVALAAPDVRSPIMTHGLRILTVQSRKEEVIVITTEAHVTSLVDMVVIADDRPAPRSTINAKTLVHMTVQRHDVAPPGIDDRVAQIRQQVLIPRATVTPPFGHVHAAQVRQLAVAGVAPVIPHSVTRVAVLRELVVQHRVVYAPPFALGRHTASLVQQVAQGFRPAPRRSPLFVSSMRLVFVLGRTTVPPWEVIDPAIGRHVTALNMLTVQHRVTTPPETISKESRYVHGVFGQVAIGDKFPLPPYPEPEPPETFVQQVVEVVLHRDRDGWAPVTAVRVDRVTEILAVGDNTGWVDPTIPVSEISVDGVVQALAVADSFLDPGISQSSVDGVAVSQMVVVGDSTMPDPALPLSEVQVAGVVEFAAVGDAIWSDPTIPLSDATVSRLTAFLALRDPSLIGEVGGSEISSPLVVEFFVIRDPTLKGIPLRQGPRPVVSVTIS